MRNPSSSRRQGVVLIAVLVCMGVATIIMLSIVQTSIAQRRQLRNDAQMEQTKWMLEAGIQEAIVRLGKEPNYEGETMTMSPAISRFGSATIEIEVSRDEGTEKAIRVKVISRIEGKNKDAQVTQRSREFGL